MRCLAAILLALTACMTAPPVATIADAQRGHVQLAELSQGRTLLVAKCSGCHQAPLPQDHTMLDWPAKLGEMSDRAGLDGLQRHLIETYLVTMAPR